MENEKRNGLSGALNKLYGGLNMSWPAVLLLAVGSALLTAVFLILPVFKDTSFERMGVTLEAWIFFAVLIMANCKKPLEAALKVFVFFLVSQPLIYLFQVPFSWLGWGLFRYYRTWFILTLLTFPGAYIGWFITKKNWLSVLIFSPVLIFLGTVLFTAGRELVGSFPHLLITALFCLAQIAVYVLVFFPRLSQKAVGLALPLAAVLFLAFTSPRQMALSLYDTLPDEPSLSAEAVIRVEDESLAQLTWENAEAARFHLDAHKTGSTMVTVSDGDKAYYYLLQIYEDGGSLQARLLPSDAGASG